MHEARFVILRLKQIKGMEADSIDLRSEQEEVGGNSRTALLDQVREFLYCQENWAQTLDSMTAGRRDLRN